MKYIFLFISVIIMNYSNAQSLLTSKIVKETEINLPSGKFIFNKEYGYQIDNNDNIIKTDSSYTTCNVLITENNMLFYETNSEVFGKSNPQIKAINKLSENVYHLLTEKFEFILIYNNNKLISFSFMINTHNPDGWSDNCKGLISEFINKE